MRYFRKFIEYLKRKFSQDVEERFDWLVKITIDLIAKACFICIWIIIQFLVSIFIKLFYLEGIDPIVLIIIRCCFAIGTLIPLILYIYIDISKKIDDMKR